MSLWTVQQHEWLHALGHPVLLLAGDPSLQAQPATLNEKNLAAASSAAGGEVAQRSSRGKPTTGTPPNALRDRADTRPEHSSRPAPATPLMEPGETSEVAAGAPAAGASRTDAAAKKAALEAARGARRAARPTLLPSEDPLVLAILRASGMEAPVFEVAAQAWRIDLVRLRAEPATKRSLWQQMRKARRNRNG